MIPTNGRWQRTAAVGGWLVLGLLVTHAQGAAYTNVYLSVPSGSVTSSWTTAANWNPSTGYPNGSGHSATIQTNHVQASPYRKYWWLDGQNITLGALRFGTFGGTNIHYETITNGTLTFQDPTGTALLYQERWRRWAYASIYGIDVLEVPVTLTSHLVVDLREERPTHHFLWMGVRFADVVSGGGGLTKRGPSVLSFSRANNTFTGNINVEQGVIAALAGPGGAFGNINNLITLGSAGRLGRVRLHAATTPFTYALSLATGGGGVIESRDNNVDMQSAISGAGRLIYDKCWARTVSLNRNTGITYSGGTWVLARDVRAGVNGQVFGTGDLNIYWEGRVMLINANNLAAGRSVRLRPARHGSTAMHSTEPALLVNSDFVPALTSDSAGLFAFNGTSGANINAALADGAPQLGNGYMRYGPGWVASATFTGSSLQPNADNVYRFIGYDSPSLSLDAPGTAGALQGNRAVELIGRPRNWFPILYLADANTFTGLLTLTHNARLFGTAQASGSPFGNPTGIVNLISADLIVRGSAGAQPVQKGVLNIEGQAALVVDPQGQAGTLEIGEIVRSNRATLLLQRLGDSTDYSSSLGAAAKIKITGAAPVPTNGMVVPWINNGDEFVTYDASYGFTTAVFNATTLAGATAASIVNMTTAEQVPGGAGGHEVYALRTTAAIQDNGAGGKLKIGSGGLLLGGQGSITHTAPLDFGNKEGVITLAVNPGQTMLHNFSNQIHGTQGLTIGAARNWQCQFQRVTLGVNNSTSLFGTITINQGRVVITNDHCLGAPGNVVVLNGGISAINAMGAILDIDPSTYYTMPATRTIWVGPNGGTLSGYAATWNSVVGGPGAVSWAGNAFGTINAVWTNEGGTYFTCDNSVTMGSSAKLGPGPVYLGQMTGNTYSRLALNGTDNIHDQSPVIMMAHFNHDGATRLNIRGGRETIGSLEGNGVVVLGNDDGESAGRLIMGGNNYSTEFFGDVVESQFGSGELIKIGTGTFTLWGEGRHTKATAVSNGAFVVNGALESPTTVYSGATLGGYGAIYSNVTIQAGGTLTPGWNNTGTLRIFGNLTLSAGTTNNVTLGGPTAGTDYAQLAVSGTLALNGATLNLALTAVPTVGQEYTIVNNPLGATVSGTFACGRIITATYGGKTYSFSVNYNAGDGNDVTLTALPLGTVIYVR